VFVDCAQENARALWGAQLLLPHSKAIDPNTLAVGRSRSLVLALSIGLGGFAVFALPTAVKAMAAAWDYEHIFKVPGSPRDCQFRSYRDTCTPSPSLGSGDRTYCGRAGDSDRMASEEAGGADAR